MCFSGGGGQSESSWLQQQQELQRQNDIASGEKSIDQNFSQFDDNFYNKQAQAYRDFAQPQVDRQWGDAKQDLEYALDRAGMEHSSAAGKARADAQFAHDQAEQGIEDTAQQTAQQTKGQVASARQALYAQLNADANAGEAASGAAAEASLYAGKPSFSPVGSLFNNLTSNLSLYAQGYPLIGTSNYSGQTGVGSPSGFGAQVFNNGSSGRVG